jgi:acyl-coenzyme A synthetase/AMP-(fatty) acid ligase
MADSPAARKYNAAVDFVDRHVAEGHADRIAIRCENRAYSYGEIAGLMNRTGNALRYLGVEMESRVFLLLHDSPQFVAAFFGAMKIGAVGDSITDGYATTVDANRAWPALLAKRLNSNKGTQRVSVVNQGISGNQVLRDGAGLSALARFDRDGLLL